MANESPYSTLALGWGDPVDPVEAEPGYRPFQVGGAMGRRPAIMSAARMPSLSLGSILDAPENAVGAIGDSIAALLAGIPRVARTAASELSGGAIDLPEDVAPTAPTAVTPVSAAARRAPAGPPAVGMPIQQPSQPDASPLFSEPEMASMREDYTARTPEYAAARRRIDSPMRAIRMPNGKFVYTNQNQYGGEEFDTADAGRAERSAYEPYHDDKKISTTMRSLVAASARAARGERAPGNAGGAPVGRRVAGSTPDTRGGGVSFIEGTPQQQAQLKLDDVLRQVALASSTQELERASMPAADRALLENRDVQAGSWVLGMLQPKMDAINNKAMSDAQIAKRTIGDPHQLQIALRNISDERDAQMKMTQDTLTVLLGIRPAGYR